MAENKVTVEQKLAEVKAAAVAAWSGNESDVLAIREFLEELNKTVNDIVRTFDNSCDHFAGEGKFVTVTRIHQPRGRTAKPKVEKVSKLSLI